MALSLNTLRPAKGSTKKKKRVGRGNSSGHGTYSTRGLKGQKSRSGVSGLKKLGLKTIIQSAPKSRGFKSLRPKSQPVNLGELNKFFKDGDKITPSSLMRVGLISTTGLTVKILSSGELKIKKLQFSKVRVSQTAKTQIAGLEGIIN
jgi:large subunit ribosomal protein L15